MNLKLIKFDEDTGMCELEVDDEAKQMLMEKGFNALIREVLEKLEVADEQQKTGSI